MEEKCYTLEKEEQQIYYGGGGITAAFVTAITSLIKITYSIGNDLGTSLRKLIKKRVC